MSLRERFRSRHKPITYERLVGPLTEKDAKADALFDQMNDLNAAVTVGWAYTVKGNSINEPSIRVRIGTPTDVDSSLDHIAFAGSGFTNEEINAGITVLMYVDQPETRKLVSFDDEGIPHVIQKNPD